LASDRSLVDGAIYNVKPVSRLGVTVMMVVGFGTALLLAVILTSSVSAQAPPRAGRDSATQRAFNNVAHENIICAAYYAAAGACFARDRRPGDEQLLAQTEKAISQAVEMARLATQEAQMKKETVTARFEMALTDLRREIDGNCSNISLIMRKYSLECKRLLEDPTSRFSELMDDAITRERRAP
jgi:hypothetical protein